MSLSITIALILACLTIYPIVIAYFIHLTIEAYQRFTFEIAFTKQVLASASVFIVTEVTTSKSVFKFTLDWVKAHDDWNLTSTIDQKGVQVTEWSRENTNYILTFHDETFHGMTGKMNIFEDKRRAFQKGIEKITELEREYARLKRLKVGSDNQDIERLKKMEAVSKAFDSISCQWCE